MKANYRDLFESIIVFFICLISCFVIVSIHASYFSPYIDKQFMVELSFFLTCATGLFVGYEWVELTKKKSN